MKKLKASVTPSGSAGSASGTSAFEQLADGKLYAVYLDYGGVATTTDVSIKLADPVVTIFQVLNNATDGWHFPEQQLPVVGALNLVVAQSTNVADGVKAYVYLED